MSGEVIGLQLLKMQAGF